VVGDLLHLGVLQIAGAEAENGEEGTLLALLLDEAGHLGVAGGAHVEVAVGGEDHPVVSALDVVLGGDAIRQSDARSPGGGATGLEVVDGLEDRRPVAARRGGKHEPGRSGVDDDRHAVLLTELIDEHGEGLLQQRQLVR